MSILSPLRVNTKENKFERASSIKRSIDQFIELIINTPLGEFTADPDFGFAFSNMRFEMFNENEGVVHSPSNVLQKGSLYQKKISGTSKNINTFASELKSAIERNEKRLTNLNVNMSYVRQERKIHITIKGTQKESQEEYLYQTSIRVWS